MIWNELLLQYFDMTDDVNIQGFRTIPATQGSHPYISAWWPPAHIIGYEHTFAHAAKDFLEALKADQKVEPNLFDGAKIMQVLEAASVSNKQGRKVKVGEIQ